MGPCKAVTQTCHCLGCLVEQHGPVKSSYTNTASFKRLDSAHLEFSLSRQLSMSLLQSSMHSDVIWYSVEEMTSLLPLSTHRTQKRVVTESPTWQSSLSG